MKKIVIGLVLVLALTAGVHHLQGNTIERAVKKEGGTLVSVSVATFEHTPYRWTEKGKGVTIYHFVYKIDGKKYEGWVNLGSFKKRWIWGHKKNYDDL